MSNPLTKFLLAMSPPPPVMPSDYDGVEYRWKFLTFRPALFQNEIYLLSAVFLYVAIFFVGKYKNRKRAETWLNAHRPLYIAQFSKPMHNDGLTNDGYSDFFTFSTGRRALSCLHTTFTLRPRHDIFQYAFQLLNGLIDLQYKAEDMIELDFTFQDNAPIADCVFAILAKAELKTIKDQRWDLSFAKTADRPGLPPSLTVMSEFADVTDNILKQHGFLSLPTLLSSPTLLPYFRSLSLTDQPRNRPSRVPSSTSREKHLILSLALPPPFDASATIPLVSGAFQLVDILAGTAKLGAMKGGLVAALRPETRVKLRKVREDVYKEIGEEAGREKREADEEEKAAAKKKSEEERLSRLSSAEQKKAMERERKRLMRKAAGKTKMR